MMALELLSLLVSLPVQGPVKREAGMDRWME